MEYKPLGCSYCLPTPQNWWWRHLYNFARMIARVSQCIKDQSQIKESSLRTQTSSTAMTQWYQCLSTLSWNDTVFSRPQCQCSQRGYTATSVYRRDLHAIFRDCHQCCNRGQGRILGEIYDHKPWPGTTSFGIEIYRVVIGTGICHGHNTYITTILRQFGMEHTQGVSTPMDSNIKLHLAKNRGEMGLGELTDCQAVMVSLIYAALVTRLDISYEVAAFSCYNSRPFNSHMTAVTRILQYCKFTVNSQLHFNGICIDIGNSVVGYWDSDWANDSADCKSLGGHVFLANNGAIASQSQKQSHIAMSTIEAEFIAWLEPSRAVKWLLQFQIDSHSS